MKIYPIKNNEGLLQAFETENLFCGRRKVFKVVKTIKGAKIIRTPKLFLSWFREESFCEFSLNNVVFEIEEPFGDNSRYLVSCGASFSNSDELKIVADAFSLA